jgi:hypothetical protein
MCQKAVRQPLSNSLIERSAANRPVRLAFSDIIGDSEAKRIRRFPDGRVTEALDMAVIKSILVRFLLPID